MKKISIKYLSVLIVFNLFSCSFLGEEIIEIPPQKSRIAMFAELFNDEESPQLVILSRTRNLNETIFWDAKKGDSIRTTSAGSFYINSIDFDSVAGSKIKLTSNGRNVATFIQTDLAFKGIFESKIERLEAGANCKMQISAPNFDTVFAEQTVPKSVKLAKAYFKRNSFKSPQTGTLSELYLEFDNDAATSNYYVADVFVKLTDGNDFYYIEPRLIKLDVNASATKFLSSENFNTKRYVWRIGIDLDNDFRIYATGGSREAIPKNVINLVVKFRSTSKDFNEYAKNLEAVKSAKDNLFGEPITPFTNIKNGYGVFIVSGKADTVSVSLR
jgi:Domain of unknown function (DUF4249)